MLYGQIKPTVIKIFRSRFRYRLWRLPIMKPLRVVGWDMKHLLVSDEQILNVYRVAWKDVQLVESEKVMQVPIVQNIDHSKTVDRRKERKLFFKVKRG